MKIVFWFVFIVVATSCGEPGQKSVNKIGLKKSSKALLLSDFFASSSSHILGGEEPIGSIDKLLVVDSTIFISDFYLMKSLRSFGQNGAPLVYRDDIGEGPMGLSEITDFEVYRDTVYVLDAHRRKILRFTLNLETIDEFDVPVPCNNFIINDLGIFIYRQGVDAPMGRLVQFSHSMNLVETLIPAEEFNSQLVLSNTGFFTRLTNSDFVVSNPFHPYLWMIKGDKVERIELDFNNQFIDVEKLDDLDPLTALNYVNNFEGFYNLTNGIRLNDSQLLFSIRHNKKPGYLKIDLDRMEMIFLDKIKNDLWSGPSTITFSGNSERKAWYWMEQEDLAKFYSLNGRKIPQAERISMTADRESKIVFQLTNK